MSNAYIDCPMSVVLRLVVRSDAVIEKARPSIIIKNREGSMPLTSGIQTGLDQGPR